jgi:FKBP-type peptidyl-prolyl cis-trans isomerase SlpA
MPDLPDLQVPADEHDNLPATVQAGSFLTLHYRLSGPDGASIVDTFGGKPATLSMGAGELSPALEAALLGVREGARHRVVLPAGAAFGAHQPDKVQRVAKSLLAQLGDADVTYHAGDVVQLPVPSRSDGAPGGVFTGTVRECGDTWVTMDFNHPLAGVAVTFEAQILGVL